MISLRRKLWLGFGALLIILFAVSLLTVIVLTRYSHTLEQVFHDNYNSAIFCDKMKASLDRLNIRVEFQLWQDPRAAQIDPAIEQKMFEVQLVNQLNNCTLVGEKEHTLL